MAAPVCHIPTSAPAAQPNGINVPSIPPATDLNSALAAIAALTRAVQLLSGQINTNNKTSDQTVINNFKIKGDQSNGRWQEVKRATEKVKVENPDDASQYVEVERINQLTMQDRVTGDQWVWKR